MMRAGVFAAALACVILPSLATAQTVSAILEPAQLIEVKPSVSGRIGKSVAREGSLAETGAVLASIDANVQNARVQVAKIAADGEAAQEKADIVVTQARTLVERVIRARRKGAAQAWEVLQARQALQLAEADARLAEESMQQRRAQLKLEQATLAEFNLNAPFSGSVLQVFIEPGEIVTTDTVAFEFGALERLKATAFVPLDWAQELARGDVLTAKLPSMNNRSVVVIVTNVDPRIDPASQTARVTLELENEDGAVFAGTALQLSR